MSLHRLRVRMHQIQWLQPFFNQHSWKLNNERATKIWKMKKKTLHRPFQHLLLKQYPDVSRTKTMFASEILTLIADNSMGFLPASLTFDTVKAIAKRSFCLIHSIIWWLKIKMHFYPLRVFTSTNAFSCGRFSFAP